MWKKPGAAIARIRSLAIAVQRLVRMVLAHPAGVVAN
jgi:hypothetical protein